MNKLFICNQSQNRSPTAAKLLGGKFTSLYNDENRLTEELLKEADVVYVFEEIQREEIGNRFPEQYIKKKIINLGWTEPPKVFEKVLSLTEKKSTIVAIGNMGGKGAETAEFFEHRSSIT